MKFKDLGLSEELLRAIEDCGYTTPTPIQEQAIPHILMTRDLVGLAQTGTGKTASFTLPMIEILAGGRAKARMPRSLILAPTRELAAQVSQNFDTYGKYHKLSMALLTGGTSMDEQVKKLERGVDVLIATPGRLLDLFERGRILLNDIKILVIDEADRMLDMGFIPDIEKIVSRLPFTRQTLLFSATMPSEIKKLTAKFLTNPREVSVAPPASPAKTVEQFIVWADKRKKREILDQIIQNEDVKNAFIFCNRKRDIGELTRFLQGRNYAAKEMHGDMAQSARTKTLEEFKAGEVALLVCSDVAARGIDVQGLSHVLNYDVPMSADDYVHRIGRTGRAGQKGRAWMLATKDETKYVDAIEKLIEKKITVKKVGNLSASRPEEEDGAEREDRSSARRGSIPKDRNDKPRDNSPRERDSGKLAETERKEDRRAQKSSATHSQERDSAGFGDDVPAFFAKK